MDLKIIYIKEDDLTDVLIQQLNNIKLCEWRVLFFVELKDIDDQVKPMISDFSILRLYKAERRIRGWLEENINHIIEYKVLVFNGRPTSSNPNYTLSFESDQELNVLLNPGHEQRIEPYLYQHAGARQIKYLSLGDFNDQDLNL